MKYCGYVWNNHSKLPNQLVSQISTNLWDWAKLVSNWEQDMLNTNSYLLLRRKRIFMLTDLKKSFLVHVNVHFTNQNIMQRRITWIWILKVLKCQKRNVSTDKAQRVYEKDRAICLIIRFIPRIMVIKMTQMAHILDFLLMTAKNQSQFEQSM